jgi:hypothetical protein
LYFCRKSDPESKGKVENVIQYIKKNFLYNRIYHDITTLNNQAVAWLGRTANQLPHNCTKKSPKSEFLIEKPHLSPYNPMAFEIKKNKGYTVRKNNTINYKGNFYTVPMGTYQGTGAKVFVKEKENTIEILSINNEAICTHTVSSLKGQTISNTNHKRDNSKSLKDMLQQAANCFTDQGLAMGYLLRVKKKYPRYARDHLQAIIKAATGADKGPADKTLDFCQKNNVLNGNEWEHVLQVFQHVKTEQKIKNGFKLLDKDNMEKANQQPQTSDIQDYEDIIND